MRRFQQAGHRPIVLVGGATGLIGDPSGRSDERNLNSPEVVADWVAKIRRQVAPFVEFDGDNAAVMANNLDWTQELPVIDFLRDVGKYFSVSAMISRESVRSRLDRDGDGLSYTEFSYMLLQAMDYLRLAESHGCSLQIGGSDQWGNIVSGMDLVRRKTGQAAFALTLPLVTRSDGAKFGKTAAGAVWLDPARTSPYAFYQFWLNSTDDDVGDYLRIFTFLPLSEIDQILAEGAATPEKRLAQQRLAMEVTRAVHGEEGVASAQRITQALFGGTLEALSEQDLEQLALDGMSVTRTPESRLGLLQAFTDTGLTRSNSEAGKLARGRGLSVNGEVVADAGAELEFSDALFGRFFLLRRGKKSWGMLMRSAP